MVNLSSHLDSESISPNFTQNLYRFVLLKVAFLTKLLLFGILLNYFSMDHLFNVHSEDLQIFVKFSDSSRIFLAYWKAAKISPHSPTRLNNAISQLFFILEIFVFKKFPFIKKFPFLTPLRLTNIFFPVSKKLIMWQKCYGMVKGLDGEEGVLSSSSARLSLFWG